MTILPALIILSPFAASPVSLLIGRKSEKARDAFFCAFLAAECVLAVLAFAQAAQGRELAFTWAGFAGFGLSFRLDGFRALYTLIAAFMWLMTGIFSPRYFRRHHHRNRYAFFTLLTLGATVGVFLSDDLLGAFIFFEIMSFTSYTWVAQEETKEALRAAETYLAIALCGGMVTLMGLFLLYHRLGSLSFAALRAAGGAVPPQELYLPGALTAVGFAAKAGMFPLHVWLPKAHPVAPAPASALLSGVLTKVGVFGLAVIGCNLFRADAAWGRAVLLPGTVTMFLGALLAVFSIDLKRTLACSSMSQIGFILIGLGTQSLLGAHGALAVQGTVLHMVNHSLLKLCLFLSAGTVYMNLHRLSLNDIRGFGRNKPLLHFAFLSGAVGLAGFPLGNGYISKSLLHEGLLEYIALLREAGEAAGLYSAVEWIFIISGGMTFAYMLKLYIAIFWQKHPTRQREMDDLRKGYLSPMSALALSAAAVMPPLLGLFPDFFCTGIATMAQGFFGGVSPAHPVHYFSAENLSGAAKSLLIGAGIYLLIIRPCLTEKRDGARAYVDRWPRWLDLEQLVYRAAWLRRGLCAPVLFLCQFLSGLADSRPVKVRIPQAFAALSRLLSGLPDARPVRVWIPRCFGALARAADEAADHAALLLSLPLSGHGKSGPPPVGTRLTFRIGRALNAAARVLNRSGLRAKPLPEDYEFRLAVDRREARRAIGRIARSLSFGLLLLGLGLVVTCIYLLLQ